MKVTHDLLEAVKWTAAQEHPENDAAKVHKIADILFDLRDDDGKCLPDKVSAFMKKYHAARAREWAAHTTESNVKPPVEPLTARQAREIDDILSRQEIPPDALNTPLGDYFRRAIARVVRSRSTNGDNGQAL